MELLPKKLAFWTRRYSFQIKNGICRRLLSIWVFDKKEQGDTLMKQHLHQRPGLMWWGEICETSHCCTDKLIIDLCTISTDTYQKLLEKEIFNRNEKQHWRMALWTFNHYFKKRVISAASVNYTWRSSLKVHLGQLLRDPFPQMVH